MRRSSYHDRTDRSYLSKVGSKNQAQDINLQNIKVSTSRVPENNFVSSRNPTPYYQPKTVKPLLHRPYTTQKAPSYIESRRQSQGSYLHKHDTAKELAVSSMKEHHREQRQYTSNLHDNNRFEQSKGRLYRGSSWKYDQKPMKELYPASSRYNNHKRDYSYHEGVESAQKPRKSGALMDLLGQNLKKSEVKNGEDFFEYIMRFSYRTKKGYIPTNSGKVNQDNFVINPNLNNHTWQHFFAVCDGHGPLGHHVSGFIKNALPKAVANCKGLDRHPKQALTRAFQTVYEKLLKQSGVDLSFSGSTIISCYFHQNRLVCANVGDSRAVVGRFRSGAWQAIPLSTDHKPTIEKEADRIRKMRGRVEPFKDEYGDPIGPLRVWVQGDNVPGLAMTRSFGDLVGASVGVSPIPQIKEFSLTDQDKIVILASDGVFQFLSNETIMKAMIPFYQSKQIQQASDHLMSMSAKSWTKNSSIVDDITFILIFISYNQL